MSDVDTDTFMGRQEALRKLFADELDPEDRHGIAFWMRQMILHVQDLCAKRAEFGDFDTGQDCAGGYRHDSDTADARRKAADDIRALRFDKPL